MIRRLRAIVAHLGHQRLDDIDQWSLDRLRVEAEELQTFVAWYKDPGL